MQESSTKGCRVALTGGSDAHNSNCVGMGYALIPDTIKTSEDDEIFSMAIILRLVEQDIYIQPRTR